MTQGLHKYRDILRVWRPNTPSCKRTMECSDVNWLLAGHIIVEEKVDGGIIGLSHKGYELKVQGRGRYIQHTENSKQVFGLISWAYQNYEKIMCVPEGWVLYGEWLRVKHNIFYDRLPDYFVAFDIWDGNKYLHAYKKYELLEQWGFSCVPIKEDADRPTIEWVLSLPLKSRFSSSEMTEGMVIKNQTNGMCGKIVRQEFDDALDEHWLKKPIVENKLSSYIKRNNAML